jgi:hypothetical protein
MRGACKSRVFTYDRQMRNARKLVHAVAVTALCTTTAACGARVDIDLPEKRAIPAPTPIPQPTEPPTPSPQPPAVPTPEVLLEPTQCARFANAGQVATLPVDVLAFAPVPPNKDRDTVAYAVAASSLYTVVPNATIPRYVAPGPITDLFWTPSGIAINYLDAASAESFAFFGAGGAKLYPNTDVVLGSALYDTLLVRQGQRSTFWRNGRDRKQEISYGVSDKGKMLGNAARDLTALDTASIFGISFSEGDYARFDYKEGAALAVRTNLSQRKQRICDLERHAAADSPDTKRHRRANRRGHRRSTRARSLGQLLAHRRIRAARLATRRIVHC